MSCTIHDPFYYINLINNRRFQISLFPLRYIHLLESELHHLVKNVCNDEIKNPNELDEIELHISKTLSSSFQKVYFIKGKIDSELQILNNNHLYNAQFDSIGLLHCSIGNQDYIFIILGLS